MSLSTTLRFSIRRRQWHPTPVLLPGESHGWRSLVGCSPWGRWESDMTEQLHFHFHFHAWRKKWQPTPVFLPGESRGWGSLVGWHLWGCTELDTTEATQQQQQQQQYMITGMFQMKNPQCSGAIKLLLVSSSLMVHWPKPRGITKTRIM